MANTFVRGVNPIWSEFDLTGNIFDDTYYMFVLQNELPYLPAIVYEDVGGTIPYTNPIRFQANGTLPNNIFWDPSLFYRIEFRRGNSQSDPLIGDPIENYSPGSGGNTPISNVGLFTDNQITNPQFSLLSFNSPFTLTNVTNPDPIEVAPGWFLNLLGTGSVTLSQIPLNNALSNATNAPYALRIILSGTWTAGQCVLSQTFNQNGMLWANKYVSTAITARIEGSPQDIIMRMDDSNGSTLTTLLTSTINSSFTEYKGFGLMPATTNPDTPPDASIIYKILLPTSVDIELTSIQLIASDLPTNFEYTEDTIERQQDYTFHYYKDSLLREPKESLLTGWDFGLNPWQVANPALATFASFGYTADQTIVITQAFVDSAATNSIKVGRASNIKNFGFEVEALTATNQFALLQYIDTRTMRSTWGKTVSSYVKLNAQKQNPNANLRVKMRLISTAGLPSTLSRTQPVASWTGSGEPVFAAGGNPVTSYAPKNDPVYNLSNGDNILLFEGFELPASSSTNMTLGIIIYTLDSMTQSGTPDNIVFDKITLVQNDFAMDCASLSFDETLRRCEYYYEQTYSVDTAVIPAATSNNSIIKSMIIAPETNSTAAVQKSLHAKTFDITYKETKRTSSPVITLFDIAATSTSRVTAVIFNGGASLSVGSAVILSTSWTQTALGDKNAIYNATTVSALATTVSSPAGNFADAFIQFHYTVDARLGLVA